MIEQMTRYHAILYDIALTQEFLLSVADKAYYTVCAKLIQGAPNQLFLMLTLTDM